jgi:hypothetical protein
MAKAVFNSHHKAVLDALLQQLPGVTPGKMFGYPAYYVHGKLFACVYGDGVGVKVPEETANNLLTNTHGVPFQPMGKPKMREWVQINRLDSSDYRLDEDILLCAVRFVDPLNKK